MVCVLEWLSRTVGVFARISWLALLAPAVFAADVAEPRSPLWETYLANQPLSLLQERCKPRRVARQAGTTYRGSVLLMHGFTGCPSQFDEMAENFSKLGFDSYLFLLPGHGLRDQVGSFVPDAMPQGDEWKRYVDFARFANEVARELPGIKAIGGLSVGGGVAMASVALDPELYDRAMFLAPYLDVSQKNAKIAIGVSSRVQFVRGYRVNWGPGCTENPDRVGYCDFRLDQLLAASRLGAWTARRLAQNPHYRTRAQFVAVENDQAVDNRRTSEALLQSSLSSSSCRLLQVDHPFFVRDAATAPFSPQLTAFFSRMDLLVTEGKFWPTQGSAASPDEIPLCSLKKARAPSL